MRIRGLALFLAATAVIAGCGAAGSPDGGAAPTAGTTAPAPPVTTPATEATASPAAAPTPGAGAFPTPAADALPPADTNTKESARFPDPSGDTALLERVAIGDHEGYERVVFTMTEGSGLPSWQVRYSDGIAESGSGEPVEIAGAAFLHVILSGASGVDLQGGSVRQVYTGPDRLEGSAAHATAVQEVVLAGDFEAVLEWGIGLDRERPFRVFTLDAPSRVVVDVLTD